MTLTTDDIALPWLRQKWAGGAPFSGSIGYLRMPP